MLSGAANDLGGALATIDAYTGKPPTVTGVNVLLKVHRGADQAFIRDVSLPARVRPGQRVRARVALQRVRGDRLTRTYTLRIPGSLRRGNQRLRFVGTDADQGESAFTTILLGDEEEENEGGDPGPATLEELAESVRATQRWDGVTPARRPQPHAGLPRRRLPHLRPGRDDRPRPGAEPAAPG